MVTYPISKGGQNNPVNRKIDSSRPSWSLYIALALQLLLNGFGTRNKGPGHETRKYYNTEDEEAFAECLAYTFRLNAPDAEGHIGEQEDRNADEDEDIVGCSDKADVAEDGIIVVKLVFGPFLRHVS